MAGTERTPERAQALAGAAGAFLKSLDDAQLQLAQRPFDDDIRYEWSYVPVRRGGLRLDSIQPEQRELALAIMDLALSERGARQAREIMYLETTLAEWEKITHFHHPTEVMLARDPQFYYVTIYGEPGQKQPWGFKIGGHHLGIHITVIDGDFISPLPLFLGTNPAEVRHGPNLGHRILAEEEDLARALLGSLSSDQKKLAIVDPIAPADILTENYRALSPGAIPPGLTFSAMQGEQRTHLATLVRHYVERSPADVSANEWRRIEASGLDAAAFAWAGPETPGQGHYYNVAGPGFLVEYDNTQNDANHVHSVWRGYGSDWGEDLLAEHYHHHHAD
jgi:hypothetical protein